MYTSGHMLTSALDITSFIHSYRRQIRCKRLNFEEQKCAEITLMGWLVLSPMDVLVCY